MENHRLLIGREGGRSESFFICNGTHWHGILEDVGSQIRHSIANSRSQKGGSSQRCTALRRLRRWIGFHQTLRPPWARRQADMLRLAGAAIAGEPPTTRGAFSCQAAAKTPPRLGQALVRRGPLPNCCRKVCDVPAAIAQGAPSCQPATRAATRACLCWRRCACLLSQPTGAVACAPSAMACGVQVDASGGG